LLQISEAANAPKLRKACMSYVAQHYDELRTSNEYQTLRVSSPQTAKKIDDAVASLNHGVNAQ